MKKILALFVPCMLCISVYAQKIDSSFAPMDSIRFLVDRLCSDEFSGRGYANNGMNKAADFISHQFQTYNIRPLFGGLYTETFQVAANQIAGNPSFTVDHHKLKIGRDYIIEPESGSVQGRFHATYSDSSLNFPLVPIGKYNKKNQTYIDTSHHLLLSEGSTIYPQTTNLIIKNNLYEEVTSASELDIKLVNQTNLYEVNNVGGIIPGTTDTIIYITAHYDHLGMQGNAIFRGASDNASGTAMMMTLASYLSLHPHRYTMIFLAFAAEETGLLGSEYYVKNFLFDKNKIKMVINLDIMGNAEGGITVVNTETHKNFLDQLKKINNTQSINLPEIRQRGNTKNSDHYWFTTQNVPAVFIYSNGGQGYYHDVDDTPENLQYTNIDKVFYLLLNYCL